MDSIISNLSRCGYFAQSIMEELRLDCGYHVIYGKLKHFIKNDLFEIK